MFGKPCVILTTPESCKKVLSDDATFGPGFPESITKLMGKKAFHGITQEEHKRLRRLTTAALSGQEALSIYLKHIEEITINSLKEWAGMSRPIEFLTEMRKIAFKVIMFVMVGDTSTDHFIMEALEKEYTTLNHGLKSMAIDLPGFAYHNALKARKNLQKIFQGVVDKRRIEETMANKQEEKKDMLDMLMGIEDENKSKLSDEEIVDLIIMFLNAGHESSGHAAMWAVVLLQDHPEVFQKAKVINTVFGNQVDVEM
ncbi:hypothetical protein SOVF_050470 [Spinacia oleracea]|nr:hypothetical protein SOVF_050470 [Spinacia oleracea]